MATACQARFTYADPPPRLPPFAQTRAQHVLEYARQKLALVGTMTEKDEAALANASWDIRTVKNRGFLLRAGERPDHIHVIVEGWAARAKILPGGARQISALLVPGDIGETRPRSAGRMDHMIVALTPLRVAYIPLDALPVSRHPGLDDALAWSAAMDHAILRIWMESVGRRSAAGRIAHLICELHARLNAVGLVNDGTMPFPLTQEELADAVGLSPANVSRILKDMRDNALLSWNGSALTVKDHATLARTGTFTSTYLREVGQYASVY